MAAGSMWRSPATTPSQSAPSVGTSSQRSIVHPERSALSKVLLLAIRPPGTGVSMKASRRFGGTHCRGYDEVVQEPDETVAVVHLAGTHLEDASVRVAAVSHPLHLRLRRHRVEEGCSVICRELSCLVLGKEISGSDCIDLRINERGEGFTNAVGRKDVSVDDDLTDRSSCDPT